MLGEPGDDKAAEDEGDAENLAHIEHHVSFEVHLIVLDELDEEANTKQGYEPPTQDAAALKVAILFKVVPQREAEDEEVAEAFVELCGILGEGLVVALENEAPRQVGGTAINLAVEEIALTDEGATEGNDNN